MPKNQRGAMSSQMMWFIGILSAIMFMIFGIIIGRKEAKGTPLQFEELRENVSYKLIERLPLSSNLSIIRQMEQSSGEFSQKVVVGVHPKIQIHDEFILMRGGESFIKVYFIDEKG